MEDSKLAAEEARRATQHESVKAQVESDVNAEIAARADRTTGAEAQKMEQVAGEFRGKAINEVVDTEREVERSRSMARISQVVDYIFYVIYALLAIRLLLALLAARSSAGFVQFIRSVTDPLYAPFRGIVASPTTEGGYTLALPIVIAIIVYALLHAGINGLLRLIARRKTEI
ncbi:MAG: YggT family protein [Pyrinomonadaceae bacterium]